MRPNFTPPEEPADAERVRDAFTICRGKCYGA